MWCTLLPGRGDIARESHYEHSYHLSMHAVWALPLRYFFGSGHPDRLHLLVRLPSRYCATGNAPATGSSFCAPRSALSIRSNQAVGNSGRHMAQRLPNPYGCTPVLDGAFTRIASIIAYASSRQQYWIGGAYAGNGVSHPDGGPDSAQRWADQALCKAVKI